MSSKAMINQLKLIANATAVSGKILRDHNEISQLQSSKKSTKGFAVASYRSSLREIVKKISMNISRGCKIMVEEFAPTSFANGERNSHPTALMIADNFSGTVPEGGVPDKNDIPGADFEVEHDPAFAAEFGMDVQTVFVITPLSGIEMFARGLPCFTVGIGLAKSTSNGLSMSQAVVYDIMDDCFYTATAGMGAYISKGYDIKMKTSATERLRSAAVAIEGFDSILGGTFSLDSVRSKAFLKKVNNIPFNVGSFVSIKNPELCLVYVASGKLDAAFFVGNFDKSSILTGLLIAEEAGVVFLDSNLNEISFQDFSSYEGAFIATSPSILPEILKVFV